MDENEKKSFGKKEQFSCTLSELHLPDHPSDEEQERRGEEEIKRAHPRRPRNKHNLNHLARDLSLKKAEMPLFCRYKGKYFSEASQHKTKLYFEIKE